MPSQPVRSAFRPAATGLLVFLLLCFGRVAAQTQETFLVSAEWLKQHIKDPDLVLLHVGEKRAYDAGHIAGARQITMADLAAPEPADHMSGEFLELPAPEAARARLEALGVSDASRIIVYYERGNVPSATRIVFTLDWLGLGERVAILDGGLTGWTAAGGSVSTAAPEIQPGRLSVRPVKQATVTRDWVNQNRLKSGVALIDARAPVYYDGTRPSMSKRGHIPGARNIPFTAVSDDTFRFKSSAQLQELFAAAGVKPGDTVITYCHIGMQGTAVWLAARALGYKAYLYDGSFHDWEKHDLPVATKAAGGTQQ